MSLLALPDELLESIAKHIDGKDQFCNLSCLARTCHRLHNVVTPILFLREHQQNSGRLIYALRRRQSKPVWKAIRFAPFVLGKDHARAALEMQYHDLAVELLDLEHVWEDVKGYLLACSAIQRVHRKSVLWYAADAGFTDIVDRLLTIDGIDIHADNDTLPLEGTAMRVASSHGHVDVTRLLVAKCGTGQRSRTDIDYSLLQASHHGHLEVAEMLLRNGAGPNPAIKAAVNGGHAAVLRLLLDHGADITTWTAAEKAALHDKFQKLLANVQKQ